LTAEYEDDFMLEFPTRSTQNFANCTLDIDEITEFTACAWFKTKEPGNIFQYSNKSRNEKVIDVFVTVDGNLEFTVNGGARQ